MTVERCSHCREKFILLFSAIFAVITGYSTVVFTYPNGLYNAIGGLLIGYTILGFWTYGARWNVLMVSLAWYSGFWSIHGLLFGFTAPTAGIEEVISITPAIITVSLLVGRSKLIAILGSICSIIYTYNTWDTANIVLAVVIALSIRKAFFDQKILLGGLMWYQTVLAVTDISALMPRNTDILYFVALTPYMASIIYLTVKKAVYDE